MVERAAKNDRGRRCLAGGVVVFLWIVPLQIWALAEDDSLQKAVNYLFTGRNDPQDAPEILNRKSCVVVVPDPKSKRPTRYYLGRFRMDTAFINKTYAGSDTAYSLDVKGAEALSNIWISTKARSSMGTSPRKYLCREIPIKQTRHWH